MVANQDLRKPKKRKTTRKTPTDFSMNNGLSFDDEAECLSKTP